MSKIEDSVCADIQTRADFGAKKYGVTMERTDLSETQVLQHAYEEALDLAVYLKKIMREKEKTLLKRSHPHAALILEYAEDAVDTDRPWERWEGRDSEHAEWEGYTADRLPTFRPDAFYRRKIKETTYENS